MRVGVCRLLLPGVLCLSILAPDLGAQSNPKCASSTSGGPGAVEGRVVDPSSGAVGGAAVRVVCGSTTYETVSAADGTYSVQVPAGSYNVRVRKEGFAQVVVPVTVAADKPTQQEITLPLPGMTEAMTVTAGGFEQLVREAPASVTVVAREELETKRVSDLAQALIDVEGVDVGQNVGKTGGLTVSLRGMPSDYTLMLIDGRRQNPPGSVTPNGFGETATTFMPPVAAIDRIEVVRGPMSTLYGSDAMGGVVNVITRKVGERWGGSVTADGTIQGDRSYGDTAQGSFYLTGPLVSNRLGLQLRGRAFHRQAADLKYDTIDGESVPVTSFGLSPTRANTQNLGGRLSYVINKNHDIYADLDGTSQFYDNKQRQLGTVGLQGGYDEEMKFRRNQFVLAHSGRLGIGLLDTSLTRNTTDTLGRTIPPGTPGRTPGSPRDLEATNTVLDSKLVSMIRNKHMLSVGGQWWDAHMVDGVAPAPYNHKQGALFAEDEWRLLRKVSATLGIRYNNHNTFGSNTSPRAYLVYTPSEIITFKGGVSRGFKTPQLNQIAAGITGFGGQGTIPLIGSPGLKPETSTSTEVGAAMRLKGVSLNLTLFHNKFQDKIATGPGLENCSFALSPNRPGCVDFGNWPNVDLFGQSINVDEALTRGIEASLRYRFLRRFDFQNNYTYTHSEQQSGSQIGQPLVNTPKHMYNATTRATVTRKLNAWVRVEARSNRTRGTGAAAEAATSQLGPFKGYGMAHLGVGYELSRKVILNATIYNLFNTDFLVYERYLSNNLWSYASRYNNLQEPRRLWLSVTYNF